MDPGEYVMTTEVKPTTNERDWTPGIFRFTPKALTPSWAVKPGSGSTSTLDAGVVPERSIPGRNRPGPWAKPISKKAKSKRKAAKVARRKNRRKR